MTPADGDRLVTPTSDGSGTVVPGSDGSVSADLGSTDVPARTFHIRTYGCQMNDHDSERLAGWLTADGLVATDDLESADVVVLNTCCIRENADNKFYGHLGNLESLRESRPDMQFAVGECLARWTASTSSNGPGTWTSCSALTTWFGPLPCCAGRPVGPVDGDPRRALPEADRHGRIERRRAVRRPRSSLCGVGHHPDRLRQLVCLLHRPVGPRATRCRDPSPSSSTKSRSWPTGASPRSPCWARRRFPTAAT